MKAIAAVDLDWGIGYKGDLLERIPEDLKYFREMTTGKVVVMGRATFETLPGKKPLKDRVNIVLSRNRDFRTPGLTVCSGLEELFDELGKYNPDDVFVIGGESVYRELLPYCTEAHITKIEKHYTADRFFPNLDEDENWELVYSGGNKFYNGIPFRFLKYARK